MNLNEGEESLPGKLLMNVMQRERLFCVKRHTNGHCTEIQKYKIQNSLVLPRNGRLILYTK